MQKKIFLAIIIIFFLYYPISAGSLEQDIELEALDINYDFYNNFISARGEVIFRYGEIFLSCQELFIDLEGEYLVAVGEVFLREGDEVLEGRSLQFFFVERRGEIVSPRTVFEEFNIWGERLKLTPDFSEIELGRLTPCKFPDPHYRVSSQRIIIFPDGRIEAFNVKVFWGEIPIFYLPYYVARYEDGTITSPFPRPSAGFNSEKGLFLGLTFEHNIADNLKGEYFFETTGRKHLFLGKFLFSHDINQAWQGEYYLEISDLKFLELIELSFAFKEEHKIRGEIGQSEDEWDFGIFYDWEMFPGFEVLTGLKKDGNEYFLIPGFGYSGEDLSCSVNADWNFNGELHRLQGEIGFDAMGFKLDWQKYRERLYLDLEFKKGNWEWWLRQREGLSVERLPQTRISYNFGKWGFGFLDAGNFKEKEVETQRLGLKYTFSRTLGPFTGSLIFEGYDYPQFESQAALESRLAWSRKWEDHRFLLGFLFREVKGETPFVFDRIEKKQQVFGEWTAKFKGDNNYPVFTTGLEVNFDLIDKKIGKLTGSLKKEQDCYYWKIELDPVLTEFEFTIGTPF